MFDTKVDKLIIAHCSDKGNLSNMDEYNDRTWRALLLVRTAGKLV